MFMSQDVMLLQLYSKHNSIFFNFLVRKCHPPPRCAPDSSNCDVNTKTLGARDSEVERIIQKLEQQTSSVLQGKYHMCRRHCSVFTFVRCAHVLDVIKLSL